MSFANEVRVEKGLNAIEAALEAGKTRLRPVLMTALAMALANQHLPGIFYNHWV